MPLGGVFEWLRDSIQRDLCHRLQAVFSVWWFPVGQLQQADPKAPNVNGKAVRFVLDHLGSHPERRAHRLISWMIDITAQTEIDDFDFCVDGEHDVCGFQVSVCDFHPMKVIQRLKKPVGDEGDMVASEFLFLNGLREGSSLHEFHPDPDFSVAQVSVKDLDDFGWRIFLRNEIS